MSAKYLRAADLLRDWQEDVISGTPPVVYPVGAAAWEPVEVGPGAIVLLGGAPGDGKTALVMQWVCDALRLTPKLRTLVCNVEMPSRALLDRQLARLSGIPLTLIRKRQLDGSHRERLDAGMTALGSVADRLTFLSSPFNLPNVAATADECEADLIVLDYAQRFEQPGEHRDKRTAMNAAMTTLRQFADAGTAIIVVSAVGRSRDGRGRSTYAADALGLASFRESSELEYGANSAYLLVRDDPKDHDSRLLRCVKSRDGELRDVSLRFDGARQHFEPYDPIAENHALAAEVERRWAR